MICILHFQGSLKMVSFVQVKSVKQIWSHATFNIHFGEWVTLACVNLMGWSLCRLSVFSRSFFLIFYKLTILVKDIQIISLEKKNILRKIYIKGNNGIRIAKRTNYGGNIKYGSPNYSEEWFGLTVEKINAKEWMRLEQQKGLFFLSKQCK